MSGTIRSRLESLRRSGELRGSREPGCKAPPPAEFLFPGEEQEVETAAGRCYLRELRIPLGQSHGTGRLEEVLGCCGDSLALLDKRGARQDFRAQNSLFLDIETTGLSGGTGTWAFLIGVGWVEENYFVLRQYFLRHPREEKAMLLHFSAWAEHFADMVTFNGRTFDLPLIQTRQVLAGLPRRTEPCFHLDLLHCSRRLWKERLSSCSLRSLEEALLGLKRHGDIPGEEIPAVYFNYLRRGETALLRQVFQHNVLDILSMVALLARATRAAAGEGVDHPADILSLGRLCAEAGWTDEAACWYQKAVCCGDRRLELAAMLQLSIVYKRQAKWNEAAALWGELVKHGSFDLTPYVELAKYYEHRVKDFARALEAANRALARTRMRRAPAAGELSTPALQHRIARLRRKLDESPCQR